MIQQLSKNVSVVADSTGAAVFTFESIPVSQTWIFTVNIPGAEDTALTTGSSGASVYGQWKGSNSFGPIQLGTAEQLVLTSVGLVPGVLYVASINGYAATSEDVPPVYPTAYADTVTTSQQQIVLINATNTVPVSTNINTTYRINVQPGYRSIYAVGVFPTDPGAGFNGWRITATGVQSGTTYQPFIPPYFNANTSGSGAYPDTLNVRFAILNGVDTQIDVKFVATGSAAGTAYNLIIGADLANVDTSIYYANSNETTGTKTKYGTIPVSNIEFLDGLGNYETLPIYAVEYGGLQSSTVNLSGIAQATLIPGISAGQAIRLHSATVYNGTSTVKIRIYGSTLGQIAPIITLPPDSMLMLNGLLFTSGEGSLVAAASAATTSCALTVRYDIVDFPSITYT